MDLGLIKKVHGLIVKISFSFVTDTTIINHCGFVAGGGAGLIRVYVSISTCLCMCALIA